MYIWCISALAGIVTYNAINNVEMPLDDVIDIPWRMKLVLPAIASMPLEFETSRIDIGSMFIELGIFYPIFATFLCVYCSNAINILAGINGIEVSQCIIIGIAFIMIDNSTMSLMLPFVTTSSVLLWFNWYPARVFVGDSYTLFSGMLFAVTGLCSHLNYTLFWMLLPQTINFCLSLPQLLKIHPCPRHRLPSYDAQTDTLQPSMYHGRMNQTLINYILKWLGPTHERLLNVYMICIQITSCSFAYYLRQ
jgi:UDP-N-acetylglucosamine--dolichyl-phosphate N-acetylglucosaminephosphotransferase